MSYLMIAGGLVFLFFGGEALLKGVISLARNLGLSKLLVSAVVIGFGTSMPELTVSIEAALKGSAEIAIGNVVGSNIANIILIIGVAALIQPIQIFDTTLRRDVIMMLFASLILCFFSMLGFINLLIGVVFFTTLCAYIAWCYTSDRKKKSLVQQHAQDDLEEEELLTPIRSILYTLFGFALLIYGSSILVDGSVTIARSYGISETVIGLTLVAVGTSLPELAASIVASLKGHGDVAVLNVLGSNIFNILAILGITSMIKTIFIPEEIIRIDIWIMLAVALGLGHLLWHQIKIGRLIGGTMMTSYVGYVFWLFYKM